MSASAGWRRDSVACGLSAACAVHCLAPAILGSAAPLLSAWHDIPWMHWLFVALAVPMALWAFARPSAYWLARLPGLAGLGLLVAGASGFPDHEWETPLTLAGALLLASAHLLNVFRIRLARSSD